MAQAARSEEAGFGTRLLIVVLVIAFAVLQWRLWLSDHGWSEVSRLRGAVEAQQEENEILAERNARLQAEVTDLKSGADAVEEQARADLGMIREGEDFYVFVPEKGDSESADE